jgi:hypothetical protein
MGGTESARDSIARGLIVAGLLLGSAISLRLLSPDYLSRDLAHRVMGVMMGVAIVVYANAVPKALSPLARMRCDPRAEQALRRFTGWTLTLGGSAYLAAWLIAPLDRAALVAVSLLGASVLVVIVRLTWSIARRSRVRQ